MPEITVVIPCFNNYGRFLDEAVESVLAQSHQDFEIVIVDDGSTDHETCALLDAYERPQTRASDGRYVCNLDADDRLHPLYLERTKAVLDADPEESLGFVTTWLRRFGNDDQLWKPDRYSPLTLALTNNVHTSSLFRRRAWEAIDGYRESFTSQEDWNLWLGMVAAGFQWEVIEEELYFYRKHGATHSYESEKRRPAIFEALLEDNAQFYRDHHRELLATLYRKLYELEDVWREKDRALQNNQQLAADLGTEREAHQAVLREYRRLEEYTRSLEREVSDKSALLDRLGQGDDPPEG